MANHKSALKRAKQNLKRRARNRALRSTLGTAIKKYRGLLASQDAEAAQAGFVGVQKVIDKAVTKGVIHKNNAARKKARLHAALKKMQAA